MRKILHTLIPASLLPVILAMILWTCGGGGGGGGGGPTTSTFTGSVSGTIVLAVDENGVIAAKDDTTGKTPTDNTSVPPRYPFSLTVPAGHDYTIYFLLPPENRIVPLYSDSANIFSVSAGGGTIDLGFVDTTQANATAENDPLAAAGVTSGGATGPDTITVENSGPILVLINRSDVGIKYRTQVAAKNPDGSVLEDGTRVKDVAVYGPDGEELPLDVNLNFYYFDGLHEYADSGSGPTPAPSSDIEAYLAATPGSLPDGFYTEVITDSNRNLHLVTLYFEQPTEFEKPTNLLQTTNLDNSITLSWANPAGVSGPGYNLRLEIRHRDENGDGFTDTALGVGRDTSINSYTIPASFVSSNLVGKQDLIWRILVRQQVGPIEFPDGTSRTVQIYRNYSADQPLSVAPSTAIPFTTGMLAGKVFSTNETPPDAGILQFAADGTATEYHTFSDGMGGQSFDTFSWNWSIDGNGRLIIDLPDPETDLIATLLADTATSLVVQVDDGINPPETGSLTKVILFVAAEVPGTYALDSGGSITFVAGGTGSLTGDLGTEDFTWSVDAAGVLNATFTDRISTVYLLATSSASTWNIVGIDYQDSTPVDVFAATLTRQ